MDWSTFFAEIALLLSFLVSLTFFVEPLLVGDFFEILDYGASESLLLVKSLFFIFGHDLSQKLG